MAKSAEGRQGVAEVKNRAGAKDIIEERAPSLPLSHRPSFQSQLCNKRAFKLQSLDMPNTVIIRGVDVTTFGVLCHIGRLYQTVQEIWHPIAYRAIAIATFA